MNAILKERIGERVTALKISWRRASLEAGFEAGFIQDIITGRSRVPGEDALASLAAVLKCNPAYLMGQSDDPAGTIGSCRCDRSDIRCGPATRCRDGSQDR